MTREEALQHMHAEMPTNKDCCAYEAYQMAIKALQAEPCEGEEVITVKDGTLKMVYGRFVIYDREFLKSHFNTTEAAIYGNPCEDCISREQAIKYVDDVPYIKDHPNEGLLWKAWIEQLPSVNSVSTESCTSTESSTDCISRQQAIDAITRDGVRLEREGAYEMMVCTAKQWAVDLIDDLPSVIPERKKGKWIHMVGFWECDQCHAEYTDMPTCMGKVIYEYCPMCGSKMEEEE